MHNEFRAVIEPGDDGGFIAFCPEVPEANGQGETEEAAIANLRDAIQLVLEYKREQAMQTTASNATKTVVTVE